MFDLVAMLKNIGVLGEVSYDMIPFGQLPAVALERLACIGSTGASNHNSGKHFWTEDGASTPLQLALGMGGDAAIKAARIGDVSGSNAQSLAELLSSQSMILQQPGKH